MLRIRQLVKHYARDGQVVRAVDGVCLEVLAGQVLAVQGPSGCGKTTLLLAAGGLLRPTQGEVWIDAQDPYALSPERRSAFRAAHVGFVFQQFYLVPYLSVLDNVLAAGLALAAPDARRRAVELLGRLGLADRAAHVPAELSTGERQRVALARALLNRPGLLLADEPTGNLDQANAAAVLGQLAAFAQAGGAVLLVTHDPGATAIATRALRMADGRIGES